MKHYAPNLFELDDLVSKFNLNGRLICYREDIGGGTKSKKDKLSEYMIEKAIQDGKLSINQSVITSGLQNFSLATSCNLEKRNWQANHYAVGGKGAVSIHLTKLAADNDNFVILQTDYTGHYPKEFCERLSEQTGAYFLNQYDGPDSYQFYIDTGDSISRLLLENGLFVDVFINPNATGGTTLGIGTSLRRNMIGLKVLCPDFVSSGVDGDITPPLLKGFSFTYYSLNDVFDYIKKDELIAGLNINLSKRQINDGLSYLLKNPGSNVFLYLGD